MLNIFDLDYQDIAQRNSAVDSPEYQAQQIWEGIYKHCYDRWNDFSNVPKVIRKKLEIQFNLSTLKPARTLVSADHQTIKTLFELPDHHYIESVMLTNADRITLCISTQAGCPVGCKFCATGRMGFRRNLTVGEIVEQVIYYYRLQKPKSEKITNIVLMGMGEPFFNFHNTLQAIMRLNDHRGLNIGARRITVSTIGISDKIIELAKQRLQVNLAVSLHAPNDDLRRSLVPISAKYPIKDLLIACMEYSFLTRRRITFEYVMIEGINDSQESALDLAKLIKPLLSHVNLIPLNPIFGFDRKAPDIRTMKEFGRILIHHGIPTSIRASQGSEIQAGCGQLAGNIN